MIDPKRVLRALAEHWTLLEPLCERFDTGTLSLVPITSTGKLKVTERPARTGRNPSTGAAIEIAAKKVVKFVPAKVLTDSVNK